MTEIIVALISGIAAVAGSYVANDKNNKRAVQEIAHQLEVAQAVTDTKMEELTREVREHNNFAHRMPVVENDIKTIKASINELKEYHK